MKKYRFEETETRGIGGQAFRRVKVVALPNTAPAPEGAEEVPDTTEVHDWREEAVVPPAAPSLPPAEPALP